MPKKYTEKEFLEKAKAIHDDKLNFDEFVYVNSITSGKIKCNVCGNVWHTRPDVLLRGCGCKKCVSKRNGESKKIPFEDVLKSINNPNIIIDEETYIDTKHKCGATCSICGTKWEPCVRDLINGHGCPTCGKLKNTENSKTTKLKQKEERLKREADEKEKEHKEKTKSVIDKFKKVHGNKYDYSKVEYVNNKTKVCIICPEHGEFWQKPNCHLSGQGCKKCSDEKNASNLRMTKEDFIKRAKKIHGDKYDYSKVDYINNHTKVCIICSIHGEFWQRPSDHLNGHGCSKCGGTCRLDNNEFIEKAKYVHGDKYDYSKTEYDKSNKRVCIICSEHGEFWQTPNDHLDGCGCPKCVTSKLETDVENLLKGIGINHKYNKHPKWLEGLELDFYLDDFNIAIECQGIQHYEASKNKKSFFNEEKVKEIQKNDLRKFNLCNEHGVKLLYYTDYKGEIPEIYKPFTYYDKDKLLKEITKKKGSEN